MTIFIKKSKKNGKVKETLWVNFMQHGKRKRKTLGLDNTKANMKRAEKEILPALQVQLNQGEYNDAKIPTVLEYMEVSFELNSGKRSESTIYGHRLNYDNYIKDKFGTYKLNEIVGKDITLWQNKLKKDNKLAKSYIMKIRGLLYTMYEDAIDNGIVKDNPVKKAKSLSENPDSKVKRIKLTPFTSQEISKILECADKEHKNLIATLFFTGVRAGELIGLKWDAINFENNTILIKEQVVNGKSKEILKTSKSRRIIPIISSLLPYLKAQHKLTEDREYVFITRRTQKHYHSAGKIREQIWVKTLEKAEVKYRNLHQTRGTFISTLISNGEDINYVSKIAGHENVKVTLEKYSEYIPAPTDNFGECFEKVSVKNGTKMAPNQKEVA
jgi:integrase